MSICARLRDKVATAHEFYERIQTDFVRLEQDNRHGLIWGEASARDSLRFLCAVEAQAVCCATELAQLRALNTKTRRLLGGPASHVGFKLRGEVFQVSKKSLETHRTSLSSLVHLGKRDGDGHVLLDDIAEPVSPKTLRTLVTLQTTGEIKPHSEFNEDALREHAVDFGMQTLLEAALPRFHSAKREASAVAWARLLAEPAARDEQWVALSPEWFRAYKYYVRSGTPPGPCQFSEEDDDAVCVRSAVATVLLKTFGQTTTTRFVDIDMFDWVTPAGVLKYAPKLPLDEVRKLREAERMALVESTPAKRSCYVDRTWCKRYAMYLSGEMCPGALRWSNAVEGVPVASHVALHIAEIHGAIGEPREWVAGSPKPNAFSDLVFPQPDADVLEILSDDEFCKNA